MSVQIGQKKKKKKFFRQCRKKRKIGGRESARVRRKLKVARAASQAFGKNFLACRAKSASESSAVLPSSQSQKCFAKYGLSA